MYRRVVSLLLLPCVLLTQSAAVFGHAHGGVQPAGHDLVPHLHTNPVPTGHHHDHNGGHHHGNGGHNHDVVDEVAPDAPVTPPTQSPAPLPEHDSDSIYFHATDAVAVERSELPVGSSVFWTAFACDLFSEAHVGGSTHLMVCAHPPPRLGHVCPLFIRHLALLI